MGAASSTGYHSSDSMSSIQTNSESSAVVPGSTSLSSDLTQNLGVQGGGTGKEKKRKAAPLVLSTLRKRFIRKRRTSKSFDHTQVFREFLEEWSLRDVALLVEHYEAQSALRELVLQADLARPSAKTCQQDLGLIYESKFSSDVDLIYKGRCFPAHRAILCIRCPFFREMLNDPLSCGSQIAIEIDIPGISLGMFNELLRYLYTGELLVGDKYEGNVDTLIQLSEQFGIPNPLREDMKYLMTSKLFVDACLVFRHSSVSYHRKESSAVASYNLTGKVGIRHGFSVGEYRNDLEDEIPCHKVVLASRSPFFKNVIQRYQRRSNEMKEPAFMRIVLDDAIVPKRYAKIILFALYCDTFDLFSLLTEVERNTSSVCSEGNSTLIVRSYQPSVIDQLMELYEVAQLLEIDSLLHGCEDIFVESLNHENLSQILQWSEQPHGSQWVHRQAMNYLREEFSALVASGTFVHLEKHHFKQAITSDFLQASELEILQAVLRWGEFQLSKQSGDREPSVAPQSVYMVGRRGPRRRDLCVAELRDIISDLICFVRVDHIVPPDSELLTSAVKRGLFRSPPSCMLDDDHLQSSGVYHKIASWIHGRKGGPLSIPRLFLPYVEEARVKAWLDEHSARELESWTPSHSTEGQSTGDKASLYQSRSSAFNTRDSAEGIEFLDGNIPVPSDTTLRLMRKREQELRHSQSARQAMSFKQIRCEATRLIQLQVVREFGLPDSVVEVLHRPIYLFVEELNDGDRLATCPVHQDRIRHDGNASPHVSGYNSRETHWSYQATGRDMTSHLHRTIPDIAMATTAMGKMHIATENSPDVQS